MAGKPFFDFNNSFQVSEDMDDTDYDALNSETFGNELSTDWEENHETLASELENNQYNDQNCELGERVASFLLDDENYELDKRVTSFLLDDEKDEPVYTKSQEVPQYPFLLPKLPAKIITVEELEARIRQETAERAQHRLRDMPIQGIRQTYNDVHGMNTGAIPKQRQQQPPFEHQFVMMPPRHGRPFQDRNYLHGQAVRYTHSNYRGFGPRHPASQISFGPVSGQHHAYENMYQFRNQRPRKDFRPVNPVTPFSARPSEVHTRNYTPLVHPQLEECQRSSNATDYRGLMSHQEKQWLASIQTMQLNNSQPARDDYYFTVYMQKHQGGILRRHSNSAGPSSSTTDPSLRPTYAPQQYENSLGKLQVGSVNAPRKIIDVEKIVVPKPQNTEKKHKYILLEIEQLMVLQLQIEDMFNPSMAISSNPDPVFKSLIDKMMKVLLSGNKLVQIMSGMKGKKFILRAMSYMGTNQTIIKKVLGSLFEIARRDSQQLMLQFLPYIRTFLNNEPLSEIVGIISRYENSFLFSNQFMVSVVANLVERADQCLDNDSSTIDTKTIEDWIEILMRLAEAAKLHADTDKPQDRPVVAVDLSVFQRQFLLVNEEEYKDQLNALIKALANIKTD